MQLTFHVEICRHGDGKLHHTGCLVCLTHDRDQVAVALVELDKLVWRDTLSVSDDFDMLLECGQVLCSMRLRLGKASVCSADKRIFAFFEDAQRGMRTDIAG